MKKLSTILFVFFIASFGVRACAFTVVASPQTLIVSAVVGSPGGNNNGGGESGYLTPTIVVFSGKAYPFSKVYLLKDGQLIMTTTADSYAKFFFNLNSSLTNGNYLFTLFSEDISMRRSGLFNISLSLTRGTATTVSGIFISPTIAINKSQVTKGNNIMIFGQSFPLADINVSISSPITEIFKNIRSDENGNYFYNLNTSLLGYGPYKIKARASIDGITSYFSPHAIFDVSYLNIFANESKCFLIGDLDNDCKVNLLDFSIMSFWYKLENFPKKIDLNKDKKIDIIDFSIMAYYWTG